MPTLLAPTVLQDAIIMIRENSDKEMGKKELRIDIRMFPTLAFFLAGRDALISTDLVAAKKQSVEQQVWIDVYKKEALGNGEKRKLKGAGRGATHKFPLQFKGIAEEFDLNKQEFKNQRITQEEYVARKMQQRLLSLYTRLEQRCIAYLEQIKSPGNKGSQYTMQEGNAKFIPWADRDFMFDNIKTEMLQNNFYDTTYVVGNTALRTEWNRIAAQGSANSTNLAYQIPGFDLSLTNHLTPPTSSYGTMYAMESGTVTLIDWNNRMAPDQAGVYKWDTMVDPFFGLSLEVNTYRDGMDSSSTYGPGYEADIIEGFNMYTDIAFAHAYSSDPKDTYVYKYELLKTGQNAPASTTAAPTTTAA